MPPNTPIDLALYRAYVDCFREPSPAHDRAFGYAYIDFFIAHRVKWERVEAERRIRQHAWDTFHAGMSPTVIRERRD